MRNRLLDLKRHLAGAGRTLSIGKGSNIPWISPLGGDSFTSGYAAFWSDFSLASLFPSPSSGCHIYSDTLLFTFATQSAHSLNIRLGWNEGFNVFGSTHG